MKEEFCVNKEGEITDIKLQLTRREISKAYFNYNYLLKVYKHGIKSVLKTAMKKKRLPKEKRREVLKELNKIRNLKELGNYYKEVLIDYLDEQIE